mmetsp:Transcript_3199/g.6903  ORF Transcript_3199/g.6903 Transcript_3199/m.6903 type:complete len:261 (-) Transcript_3199:197-979(-)
MVLFVCFFFCLLILVLGLARFFISSFRFVVCSLVPFRVAVMSCHVVFGLDILHAGIKVLDVLRKYALPFVQEPPQLVEMLDGQLDLLFSGTPQIHSLGHQQRIDRAGVFLVGPALHHRHLLVVHRLHGRIFGQIGRQRDVVRPLLVANAGLQGIEPLVGQPGGGEFFPVRFQIGRGGLDAVLGDRPVGVSEAAGLDHELQEVVGRPFQLGRHGGHAVFGRSHQQREIGVQVFQFVVVFQVPISHTDRGWALRASKEPHRR